MSVAGLLLAAGGGERFGAPKALLRVAGERFVDRGVRVLRDGGCDPVVVVSGAAQFDGAVHNPGWEEGIGSSLRAGLDALDASPAVVIALADQPLVGAGAVERLVAAWREGAEAVIASYGGEPGNPVLLDRGLWSLVREHAVGDVGARGLLRSRPDLVTLVACDGTGRPVDIDTPSDAARLLTHTVLFDLDGVLVDSREPITSCINRALAAHGLPEHPRERLLRCIGPPLADALHDLVEDPGVVPALVDTYRRLYADAAARASVFPGITELLAKLQRTHRLAVVTSKGRRFAEAILDEHGLATSFELVAGPELEAGAEPKRVTLGRALEQLGLAGGLDVAIVGDRHHDVDAGRAHHLLTIGVTWGIGSAEELRAANAHLLVGAPAELLQLGRLADPGHPRAQRFPD